MIKIAKLAVALTALSVALSGCFFSSHHRHGCRDHESWDGSYCRADHGYEHYHDRDHDHDHHH